MPIRRLLAAAALLGTLFPYFAWAWGNEGHRYINRVAALNIPSSMPLFFHDAVDRIEYLGPEPDRWRERTEPTLKNAQEPDHYIDLERLDGFGELPEKRYEFYRRLYDLRSKATSGADDLLPERVGLQPYETIEIYDRLKVAFREYRQLKADNKPTVAVEQDAVFYAGWLGHYVADASQPLHTTIHYNGWFGQNPNGYTTSRETHSNFESKFVAANIHATDLQSRIHAPVKLDHPFQDYVQYLRHSNGLVEKFYQLEKSGAFRDKGTPEGLEFTRERMAAGSQMLLNLWYTAWIESSTPIAPYETPAAPPLAPKATPGE